jgi:hypothetical protein
MFLILQPDIITNSLALQAFRVSPTDSPDVLDGDTLNGRRNWD